MLFDFSHLFGNNFNTKHNKNKRKTGRTCRFEELESREMLSVTPWTLADYDEVPIMEAGSATTWSDRIDPANDPVAPAIACAPGFHSTSPALTPLAAVPDDYNTNDWNKLEAIAGLDISASDETAGGKVEWVNIGGEWRLERLDVHNMELTELDISDCTALDYLDCSSNQLTELDLTGTLLANFASATQTEFSDECYRYDYPSGATLYVDKTVTLLNDSPPTEKITLTSITVSTDSPEVGTEITLTLTPAGADVEYRWYRGEITMVSTASSYTPIAADVGYQLRVIVTGTGDYSGEIERTLTDAVIHCEFNTNDWLKLVAAGLIDPENNSILDGATIVWSGSSGDENRRLVRLEIVDLDFAGNGGTLDLSGCSALDYLDCTNNKLTELILTGCSALVELHCESNLLTELNVTGLANLEVLHCYDNQLTTLNASGLSNLIELQCGLNQLTSLFVSGCVNLEILSCFNNQLTALDVSSCGKLESLWCGGNVLTFNTLPPIGCAATYNYITVFDMAGNPSNVGQKNIEITLSSAGTVTLPDVGATGWTWYINGKVTTAYMKAGNVFTFTKLKIGDVLHCEMTNETYYRLILLTSETTSSVATTPNIESVTKKIGGDTVAVTLTWESGTLDWGTGYEIQYSVDGGQTWKFWTNGSTTVYTGGTSLDITNLSAGNLQFRVRSVNVIDGKVVDASDWSVGNTETLSALDTTEATKPKKVTVGKRQQNEAPTISTVTLNVVPGNSNAVSYIVVGTYKVGKTTLFAEFSYTVVGNKLVIMGLNAGTKYTFYVAAVNSAGNTSGDVGKGIQDLAKDKGFVKVSAKTAKYPASTVKGVPKSAGLNFVKFATTPSNKQADMTGFTVFDTKIVVSYTVKTGNTKTTYEGTLIEGVLDTASLKAFVNKQDADWQGTHPLNNLLASVAGNETTLNGLPAAGMKYSVAVSTLASGLNGTVESSTTKTSISTLKFTAPKSLKYMGAEDDKLKLQWKIDPKIAAFVNLNGYTVTSAEGTEIAVTNVSVDSITGLATGYFVPQAGVEIGTKYTYTLTGKSLSSAGALTSLPAKVTIKMPSR